MGSWPGSLTPTIPAGDLPTLSPLAGPKDDKRPDVTVSIGRIEVVRTTRAEAAAHTRATRQGRHGARPG